MLLKCNHDLVPDALPSRRLAGRPGEQARLLDHLIKVGECGPALEEITGVLTRDKIAITDQERSDMLALARTMKTGNLIPRAPGFCPQGKLSRPFRLVSARAANTGWTCGGVQPPRRRGCLGGALCESHRVLRVIASRAGPGLAVAQPDLD
jgi:hypothetical protein